MRRTIPQKGQSVPSPISEHGAMETQAKQALPENNRRVRTSAAMIGLAVSMSAYGLPLTTQGDHASAAESATPDSTASTASASFETAAVLSTDEAERSTSPDGSKPLSVRHTVQEGQTLWDVARFYDIDASVLASLNGLSLDSVLRVGQVLVVPVDTRVAQASTTGGSMSPGYYGLVSGNSSSSSAIATAPTPTDVELKSKQDQSLATLAQRRESLRASLADLNAKTQTPAAAGEPAAAEGVRANPMPNTVAPLPQQFSQPQKPATPEIALTDNQQVAFNPSSQLPGANPSSLTAATHRVMPGDTLTSIARANGVTLQQLLEANRISDPNYIFVGQALVIPAQNNAALPSSRFAGAIAAAPGSTVVDVPSVGLQQRSTATPASEGSMRVAAVTTFPASRSTLDADDSPSRMLKLNHVENLKLEIDRMRTKFQARSGQVSTLSRPSVRTETLEQPVTAKREPVNPEFNPDRYATRLQEIRDRIRPGDRAKPVSVTPAAQSPQLMAAAPLGSEAYDPLKARLGRTVSPELPSLGTGSEFLPNVPGQMNGYIWPARGVLTSGYGWRWGRMHRGIDIAGPIGTPIVAAADGRVTYAGWNSGGFGYLVEIQHPDGSLTLYAHNNRILVQVGQEVEQGQQISEMGSTGYSTGPHLHFEVHPTGRGAVNPMALLPRS